MKCAACGYETIVDGVFKKGFFHAGIVHLSYTIQGIPTGFNILYACPKCGTVRIEEKDNG